METVFIIAMAFADWDDCQNYASAHDLRNAEAVCAELERPRPPLAPRVSIRPKAREDLK